MLILWSENSNIHNAVINSLSTNRIPVFLSLSRPLSCAFKFAFFSFGPKIPKPTVMPWPIWASKLTWEFCFHPWQPSCYCWSATCQQAQWSWHCRRWVGGQFWAGRRHWQISGTHTVCRCRSWHCRKHLLGSGQLWPAGAWTCVCPASPSVTIWCWNRVSHLSAYMHAYLFQSDILTSHSVALSSKKVFFNIYSGTCDVRPFQWEDTSQKKTPSVVPSLLKYTWKPPAIKGHF